MRSEFTRNPRGRSVAAVPEAVVGASSGVEFGAGHRLARPLRPPPWLAALSYQVRGRDPLSNDGRLTPYTAAAIVEAKRRPR